MVLNDVFLIDFGQHWSSMAQRNKLYTRQALATQTIVVSRINLLVFSCSYFLQIRSLYHPVFILFVEIILFNLKKVHVFQVHVKLCENCASSPGIICIYRQN